jgi:amino acid/amide ABC transporter membrane protein 2, HAAT family (TC 3.A.1.4.-)
MKIHKAFWIPVLLAIIVYGVFQYLFSAGMIDAYFENIIFLICINLIFAASLHLIIGITGQFSIGHAGFISIGAYVSAVLTMKMGFPFLVAVLAGGLAAGLAGIFIGVPSFRLKGDYLAIATLGFGEIIRIILLNIDAVGGAAGMLVQRQTDWTTLYVALMLAILIINNFTRSTHGRACIALREDEIAADAMGINTTYYKVIAFVIGSFFAGIGGALYAHNFYIIQPQTFGFLKSFDILIFVVLGGLGSLTGTVIATLFLTIVSSYLQDYPETRMILYSAILIITMIFRPQGLMGTREWTDVLFSKRKIPGGGDGGKQTAA